MGGIRAYAVRETAALEIEHRQLLLDPNAVATSIASFLELPEAVAGYSYDERYFATMDRLRAAKSA